ncbi:hypothetical protein FS837_000761, partial [Tulasnella sp. UAMH 9824]
MQKADREPKASVSEVEERCIVINLRTQSQREAIVLERRGGEAYVHYVNTDKRLDEWVSEDRIHKLPKSEADAPSGSHGESQINGTRSIIGKRRRSRSPPGSTSRSTRGPIDMSATQTSAPARSSSPPPHRSHDHLQSTKEQDLEAAMEHRRITAKRNFDKVIFGGWEMKTWYYSPYPVADDAEAPPLSSSSHPPASGRKWREKERGGSAEEGLDSPAPGPPTAPPQRAHGRTAELLAASGAGRPGGSMDQAKLWVCDRCFKYMREGIPWELHTLFCQNLALFGKLFIDVKTIFFDCDNCYELSRRAGKLGTPARPLSDLGLRGYLSYWVATLVRFFRRILGTAPEEDPNAPPGLGGSRHSRKPSLPGSGKATKRKIKGFDGETIYPKAEDEGPSAALVEQPAFGSIRTTHTETTPNGTTQQHLNIRCTLIDIARATGLRHEDVAFAMEECGLLMRRKKEGNGQG